MPNYLVFAILSTVLCCLPAGIPAIVYAAQVNGRLQVGDVAGAQAASNNAKMWCWISLGLGLAFGLIYGIAVVVGIMNHMNH
ncbi:MAG: CD225/dispanin family protein [Candidatus Sulfotelmatobacter sp.]